MSAIAFGHDYEPDGNQRHIFKAKICALRLGIGYIKPTHYPLKWFAFCSAREWAYAGPGFTIWIARIGFGWRWQRKPRNENGSAL